MIETLKSTEVLTKEGFKVMVYCNDDPLMCKRLENSGASAIMPLAAPIGSGLGIQNKTNIKILRHQTKVPLIIDAGIGQASDATEAMEMGCDAVLINTAIAKAKNPFQMADAMKYAVISGRKSYLSGRIAPNFLRPVAILFPSNQVKTSVPSFLRFDNLTPAPRLTSGPRTESPT